MSNKLLLISTRKIMFSKISLFILHYSRAVAKNTFIRLKLFVTKTNFVYVKMVYFRIVLIASLFEFYVKLVHFTACLTVYKAFISCSTIIFYTLLEASAMLLKPERCVILQLEQVLLAVS